MQTMNTDLAAQTQLPVNSQQRTEHVQVYPFFQHFPISNSYVSIFCYYFSPKKEVIIRCQELT